MSSGSSDREVVLLLEARRRNLIKAIRPPIEELAKSGYYLSESLIDTVCRMAGEP